MPSGTMSPLRSRPPELGSKEESGERREEEPPNNKRYGLSSVGGPLAENERAGGG